MDMKRKRIIVDSDAGIDDGIALTLLLAAHKLNKIQLLGITCVNGNTCLDNVVNNVFRTLQACDAENIPVYKGANSPLLNMTIVDAKDYHGSDGFGDTFTDKPDISKLEKEHAVDALNRIVNENPGEISVVCLGPLTNIALTIKMYPNFIRNVKDFWIMGGNYTAQGNITSQAEFNFFADPESVHIFLSNNDKPHLLLPWETCCTSAINHEWRTEVLGKINSRQIRLINSIEYNNLYGKGYQANLKYIPCDAILAAIVLRPDMAKKIAKYHADIELSGLKTRGQVVIDHLENNESNVDIVTEFDSEILKELLIFAADPHNYSGSIL